jgi:hypothetical protein
MSDAGLSVYLNFSLTALRVCVGLKKLGKAPGNPDGFPNENTTIWKKVYFVVWM